MRRGFSAVPPSSGLPLPLLQLERRGFVHQCTLPLSRSVSQSVSLTAYAGFDPTSDALHLGNLTVLMALAHLRRAGASIVCLVGGATGMVGDPSGRQTERTLLEEEKVRGNAQGIRICIEKVLGMQSGDSGFKIVNNLDWWGKMSAVEYLRDVGKYFRVSSMLARESVRSRMSQDGEGISFTEFAYQTMQGYDFAWLYEKYGVNMQIGGSDQWGNIISGMEFVKKKFPSEQNPLIGMTIPLLVSKTGQKFGKSAGNAIWLDKSKTSPFEMHQYLMNVPDSEIVNLLKLLTLIDLEEIQHIESRMRYGPESRIAQKILADSIVTMLHGERECRFANIAAKLFFAEGSLKNENFSVDDIVAICDDAKIASLIISKQSFNSLSIKDLILKTTFVRSSNEAKKLISNGGLYINGNRVALDEFYRQVTDADLLDARICILRFGKKKFFLFKVYS